MDKFKKTPPKAADGSETDLQSDSTISMSYKEGRRIRKVNPLGYRVLVRLAKDDNMTDTGLYLPEGAKQNMQESLLAQVVDVASAVDDDTEEEANVSGIPLGANVLIPKGSGVRVPWDDDLRIVETKNILAIVEEVEII